MSTDSSDDDPIRMFLNAARLANWTLRTREKTLPILTPSIIKRYPHIPDAFMDFLSLVLDARPSNEAAWFLCEGNYNGTSGYHTKWNEWEIFDCDNSEDDADLIYATKEFWDQHLPIMMSVRSDFAYLAIDLSADHYGSIVYGYTPFFLEPRKLYSTFSEFLIGLAHSITLATSGLVDNVMPWQLTDFI